MRLSKYVPPAFTPAVLSVLTASALNAHALPGVTNDWVYPGPDGKLVYRTTPAGDRIMDFSAAGYMGGGVALPSVPTKLILRPKGRHLDDTPAIQAAIDKVSAMPLEGGFRGAVVLAAGTFTCSNSIYISTSGVVLRGSGSGWLGTTLRMVGPRHSAVIIGNGRARRSESGPTVDDNAPISESDASSKSGAPRTVITDAYVPSGTSTFTVSNAAGFAVGETISIRRPTTAKWVHFMHMDDLVRGGRRQTWIGRGRDGFTERKITALSGNQITVDIPLADSYDATYLNPPGTTITLARPESLVSQVGVERLHFQCPPLEIAYGRAPYSAIRITGQDCWVRDVYCEETMNSTAIRGRRITMEQVVVKHTYPNLGASKPTDFSIEGSQILIDRCKITGDNMYFVWTASLYPGPNVVLNSTFRGRGSRIQPHMRWSTGLLVDNCTVPDGGIDFMNRGVAGSGHGWTMGWAVAWNCVAHDYIIQNPPGAVNWAIGCLGTNRQVGRMFDKEPLLPAGIFVSNGRPVTPPSLYLAQLAERLGPKAMRNIGYGSNSPRFFDNKSVPELPPLKRISDKSLGPDLAMHRPVNASNVRGNLPEFRGEKAVDGKDNTWWSTDDDARQPYLEVDMEGPVQLNAAVLEEAPTSYHVEEYKIEGMGDSGWKELAHGTTIGVHKVDRFPATTVWKVRLTILKSDMSASISKFGLYNAAK